MTEDDEIEVLGADEIEGSEDDDTSSGGHRIPEDKWIEMETAYELGVTTQGDLAAKYGVSRQSISRRFKRRGITSGSKASQIAAAATAAATAVAAKRASEFAEKRADMVEQTRMEGYNTIRIAGQLMTKLISDTRASSHSLATIQDDLKVLVRYQDAWIRGTRARLKDILNADALVDEATLPSLVIDDITQAEIDKIQRGDEDSDDEVIDIDAELEALI